MRNGPRLASTSNLSTSPIGVSATSPTPTPTAATVRCSASLTRFFRPCNWHPTIWTGSSCLNGGPTDRDSTDASPLAGLYLTGLLKRFESSLAAAQISLHRLDRTLELFQRALDGKPPRVLSLPQQPELRRLLLAESDDEDGEEGDAARLDHRFEELLHTVPPLTNPETYDLQAIRAAVHSDRAGIARLVASLPPEENDSKFEALVDLLTRPSRGPRLGLADKRLLLFTQFRDTAIYLHLRLREEAKTNPAIGSLALLHGGISAAQRDAVTKTFDPSRMDQLGDDPPRILVSTDVLAEGHNLQMGEAVINYDLHWNPQNAVQRSGRVDRLNSPHPVVSLVSFLPEDDLEAMLGLVDRLNQRFRLYARLGLADEPVTTLSGDQVVGTSLEQLRRLYEGDAAVLDEIERSWTLGSTDFMRAPLDAFMREGTAERLDAIPRGVQSIKRLPREGTSLPEGVFIALLHGAGDDRVVHWRYYPRTTDGGWDRAMTDEVEIFHALRCSSGEPRRELPDRLAAAGPTIIDWDLLRRAAEETATEINRVAATNALTRGASDRSAKLRARLLNLVDALDTDTADVLLDRLEQVAIEDYDHDARHDQMMDRIRQAERAEVDTEAHRHMQSAVDTGLELLGVPEDETAAATVIITAQDLRLSAYEILLRPPALQAPSVQQESMIDVDVS